MTLCKGDHVVIKRNGKILSEKDEAYHEFEVEDCYVFPRPSEDGKTRYIVKLKVVK